MRILFLGTPEFAVPSLEKLIEWDEIDVLGVVTQPDRPAGRGKNIFPPPTKLVAERFKIPVLQPEKLSKSPEIFQRMQDLRPDLLVTVAFGQILKRNVLNMARLGVMNVHGSLLPKYRGAAPINWAIINGEKITGVTTMFSDEGIDTGDMLLKREMQINDDMDAETLANAMSIVGADLLKETIKKLIEGNLVPEKQDNEKASYAPRLTKDLGNIDWDKSSSEIHNLVRGLSPWPGTYTNFEAQQLKIMNTKVLKSEPDQAEQCGKILSCSGKFIVACGAEGKDRIELVDLKPANKGRMSALSWANGLHLKAGSQFVKA